MAQIVSVHSFRGGTGKSNLSANLAALLAQTGKKVAVIDADVQSPGIHTLFNLDEHHINLTLNDYLWGHCNIEECVYDVTYTLQNPFEGKVFLIPSSSKVGDITRVLKEGYNVTLLKEGFRHLITDLNLDYLLVDTHPGLNEETLLAITVSNTLVVVLRPDRQDYTGTAVILDLARRLKVPRIFLVVNRVLENWDKTALQQQMEATYGIPVTSIFHNYNEMMQLASSGIFCQTYPDHPLTLEMKALAEKVLV